MCRLICGDCMELLPEIQDGSVDMVLCDMPYGSTKNTWDQKLPLDKLWEQYSRIVKEHGAICLFADGMFLADLMKSNRKMWRYNLIWDKVIPTGFLNANRMPLRRTEEIADVQIVLDQMKMLYPMWDGFRRKKLQRLEERIEKERQADADEGRTAGDRAAAAGGDGPAVRRPPGEGGSGAAGPVQGESEAGT